MENITNMEKSQYHHSIIDGLLYFSKKGRGNIKKEQIIHFLGCDNHLNKWNIFETAQLLNLKCQFDAFDYDKEKKNIINTLIEIDKHWYILKDIKKEKIIVLEPRNNIKSEFIIDKKKET